MGGKHHRVNASAELSQCQLDRDVCKSERSTCASNLDTCQVKRDGLRKFKCLMPG